MTLNKAPIGYVRDSEHYQNVKDAVSDAALGQNPLTIEDLAHAIVVGLYQYGNHTNNLIELAKAMLRHSDEPVEVYNKADEHR